MEQYYEKADKAQALLKEVSSALRTHEVEAERSGGITWGHVGDMDLFIERLEALKSLINGEEV